MKTWVFVEGESDRLALQALWKEWFRSLQGAGHGIRIIALDGKAKYFRKIGCHAAERLANNDVDLVVGLPDLYPNREYEATSYKHRNEDELASKQRELVRDTLVSVYGWRVDRSAEAVQERFYPAALKHDAEMLLLAAEEELRAHLRTDDRLGNWKCPVENQNQDHPPKVVVEALFRRYLKRRYAETRDANAVLARVTAISTVLFDENRRPKCPVFRGVIDWIARKTGTKPY